MRSTTCSVGLGIWEVPDVILFHIVSYMAAPTHRTTVLCQLGTLCKAANESILQNEEGTLWQTVLKEDYGAVMRNSSTRQESRCSKRLRRSAYNRVREAHGLVKANTEIAFFYLTELCSSADKPLSRARLCNLIEEYGPHLRINSRLSSGGVYLVEICRARHVRESVIQRCVQELVESYGALVDLRSDESTSSRQTALAVAAVRGMSSVVKYLLQQGASISLLSSGRFRLHTSSRRSIKCMGDTPLGFAKLMRTAELEAGATKQDLRGLDASIRLLTQASKKENTKISVATS